MRADHVEAVAPAEVTVAPGNLSAERAHCWEPEHMREPVSGDSV